MKLQCNIEVNSRLLASVSLAGRRKPQRGCLSIARQSVKNKELYLLLQTVQNKQGTKYKVDQNIEKVFTKFVAEGKATIRMKEPPHDLIVQCDAIQLKSFLHILKLGVSKQVDPSVLSVSNMNPKNIAVPKTKVVVKTKAEYPILEGFPRTTEALYISGLERKSFDRQILRLQSLRVLDLSNNLITSLPKEVGSLPNLTELHLASNYFGKAELSKWSWMNGPSICKTIRLLDLTNNGLKVLPDSIQKLGFLVTLKLGDNSLERLPQGVGNLLGLKYLELQNNSLAFLPGNMFQLRLAYLDVSHNVYRPPDIPEKSCTDVPSLIEAAARVIINTRFLHHQEVLASFFYFCRTYAKSVQNTDDIVSEEWYKSYYIRDLLIEQYEKVRKPYDASRIPFNLVAYLDGAKYCICGKAGFNSLERKLVSCPVNLIAVSVKSSGNSEAIFDCYYCSARCFRRICYR